MTRKKTSSRRHRIGVIGAGHCPPEIGQIAEDVGRLIARKGAILICGGMGGVMEAAARGARDAEGTTVGILPGLTAGDANSYIDIPVVTGMGEARNVIIVRSADAVIAVSGGHGTLSEIAFCLKLGVPVVGLRTWTIDPAMRSVETPAEAVDLVFRLIDGAPDTLDHV